MAVARCGRASPVASGPSRRLAEVESLVEGQLEAGRLVGFAFPGLKRPAGPRLASGYFAAVVPGPE